MTHEKEGPGVASARADKSGNEVEGAEYRTGGRVFSPRPKRPGPRSEFRRNELTSGPQTQPKFTRVRLEDRQYFIIEPYEPGFEPVAVRIVRMKSTTKVLIELNGKQLELPWAAFDAGPSHPEFQRVAKAAGIKLFPLPHYYWFLMIWTFYDDADKQLGSGWARGRITPSEDDWDAIEERDAELRVKLMQHRYGSEFRAYQRYLAVENKQEARWLLAYWLRDREVREGMPVYADT